MKDFTTTLSTITGIKSVEIINESQYSPKQLSKLIRDNKGILVDTRSNAIYNATIADPALVMAAAFVPVVQFGKTTTTQLYAPSGHTTEDQWLRSFEKAVIAASGSTDRTVTTTNSPLTESFLNANEVKSLLKKYQVSLKTVNINTLTELPTGKTLPNIIWGTSMLYNELTSSYQSMTNIKYGVTKGFISSENIINVLPSITCNVFIAELCNVTPQTASANFMAACQQVFTNQQQRLFDAVSKTGHSYLENVVAPAMQSIFNYRSAVVA